MIYTRNFKQLSKTDISLAGGKGASLGEMIQAKIPVPPGFVVLAPAFDKFLEETGLGARIGVLLGTVDPLDANSVDQVSDRIRDLVLDADFPEDIAGEITKEFAGLKTNHVAVRSSATAEDSSASSWAGELESYLNTTKAELLGNVKKCWTSLFTPRAIFYRFEKKFDKIKVSVAVVVQKMVQSQVSGICFTVHPVTKDYGQMVIEAGYGLGEAIVGGMITPDTYVIDKKSAKITDKNISLQEKMIVKDKIGNIEKAVAKPKQEKQKLIDAKILHLARICAKIEKHYGTPQDIEWSFADGKFYIVQSRPITTL